MNNYVDCEVAIIEFGECDKNGYIYLQGSIENLGEVMAHTYWYPDDITNEEANQEVVDLCEQYKNVVILLPILDHVHLEGLAHE